MKTGNNFNERCYAVLKRVPKGKVITYKSIAKKLKSKGYRAVGKAMNKNPYSPKVPCHRVVNSDGRLGGYAGGINKKRNNIFSPKNLLIGFVVIIVLLFAFNYFYPAFSNKNSNIDENSGLGKLFSVICVPAIGRGCYPEYPHHISGPYDTYEKCKEACEEGNNLENAPCRNCRQEKYKSEDGKDEYYCVYWDSNNGDSCKIFPDIFSGSDDMIVIDGYKSTCLKGNCLKCEGGCLSCQTCVGENICKNPGIGEPGGCPEDTPDPDNSVCYKCEFDPKTCTSKWVKEKDGPIRCTGFRIKLTF